MNKVTEFSFAYEGMVLQDLKLHVVYNPLSISTYRTTRHPPSSNGYFLVV